MAAHLGVLSRVEECIAGASYRLTLRWFWPSSSSIRVCACPWQWVFSQCRTPVCILYWGTEPRRSWKEDLFGSSSSRSGQMTRHITANAEYLHDVLNDWEPIQPKKRTIWKEFEYWDKISVCYCHYHYHHNHHCHHYQINIIIIIITIVIISIIKPFLALYPLYSHCLFASLKCHPSPPPNLCGVHPHWLGVERAVISDYW